MIFGSHPSVTNSPMKGSSIIAFDKFAIKVVNNGETVDHLPREF